MAFPDRPLRVVHVITGLGVGGAEIMLQSLLSVQMSRPIQNQVFSLTGEGALAEPIRQMGVPVFEARGRHMLSVGQLGTKLAFMLRRELVDVVQTWMYHANLIGTLAGALARVPVVWGLHTTVPPEKPLATRLVARMLVPLSHVSPACIISCSEISRRAHVDRGYDGSRIRVVPNGFDIRTFRPNPQTRGRLRAELGVSPHALLVGLFARFHPQKDHRGFLQAAALIVRSVPGVRFVLCGTDVTLDNPILRDAALTAGVLEHCHFLGLRRDLPSLLPALDVLVSSSQPGEAFPLILGEAMACGIPCVATDVGDSARIVSDTGLIVPPGNPSALAGAVVKMLREPEENRRVRGSRARNHVANNFGLDIIAAQYEAIHREVAGFSVATATAS